MLFRSLLDTFEEYLRIISKAKTKVDLALAISKDPPHSDAYASLAEMAKAIDALKAKLELYKKLES